MPLWKSKPAVRTTPYKARVSIYQCENLPPADKSGNSDPYVQVYDPTNDSGKMYKTNVCEDTNNPIFYEVLDFSYNAVSDSNYLPDLSLAPPIILNIWDYDDDLTDSTDDLIGRAVINLADVGRISMAE